MGKKIIIVGAGLCGSLLAIRMAQRGYQISLHEKRPDLRKEELTAGRSINLALSSRGLDALDRVGLKDKAISLCIPMKGRMIHPLEGEQRLSPYSGRSTDYINSISRPGLNALLLDVAESMPNVDIAFNSQCTNVNLKSASGSFMQNGTSTDLQGDILIGTDGAGSVVRRSMMASTTALLFNYSQDFLRHGYKELSILPDANGDYKIEKNALHIWPRGSFMIIALPNLGGSFTVTMFHPYGTDIGFDNLKTADDVEHFFKTYFPDLIELMPHYKEEYFENPVGTLGTIKCNPWQAYQKTLIMGDAAHAIVPFYGQGMNASFEDVLVFDNVLDACKDDLSKALIAFEQNRIANADAIGDLALDNFYEMQDKVADPIFIKKRTLEMQLEQKYDNYYSKYSLVTFRPDLSYREAMILGRKQDDLLLQMCASETLPTIEDAYNNIKKLTTT